MASIKSVFELADVKPGVPKNLKPAACAIKIDSKDLIGIEVEVENVNRLSQLNPIWMEKSDGSLRNNGLEYVTYPIEAHYAPAVLEHLLKEFLDSNCCFSPRTSTHVHLNMQDFDSEQLIDFVIIYSIFEKLLYRFAGRGRIKNIYCVPITETNSSNYFLSQGLGRIQTIWSKYTGLNLLTLRNYGTVEFRHMHGTFDVRKLSIWINLITSIKDYVRNTPAKDTRSMLFAMDDSFDFDGLMKKVFREHSEYLKLKSIDDVRNAYMQAKLLCLKNTQLVKIHSGVSGNAPFFKGIK